MINESIQKEYKSYDYKQVVVKEKQASYYIDCYENFGWFLDENKEMQRKYNQCLIYFKRDKNIANKAELIRLEQNFDACILEINELEHAKYVKPTIQSMTCGLIGITFVIGSIFAIVSKSANFWASAFLALLGILGLTLPYFIFRNGVIRKTKELKPFIENKYMDVDNICRKGNSLL